MKPNKPKICGFSMGAPEPRRCIKAECSFWIDTEEQIKELIEEAKSLNLDEQQMNEDIESFKESVGDGFCSFLNL